MKVEWPGVEPATCRSQLQSLTITLSCHTGGRWLINNAVFYHPNQGLQKAEIPNFYANSMWNEVYFKSEKTL